jgi:glutaminyl-peptide cyclotransferase
VIRRKKGTWVRALAVAMAGLVGLALAAWLSLYSPWTQPQRPVAAAAAPGPKLGPARVGQGIERLRVEVLNTYPHDPSAFTQGLVWRDAQLYESTGLYAQSTLRRVSIDTGDVLQQAVLEPRVFAEGLADVGDRLIQLTWREGIAPVYDIASFQRQKDFTYQGEGWGLCYDGVRLVMSDGSSRLTFRDPDSFAVIGGVDVTAEGRPIAQLNELECVGDRVYSNVWQTETILRIDPASGQVDAMIDAAGLLSPSERQGADVLNGIAYDPTDGTFLITGKHWPKLFRAQFVPAG